MAESKVKQADIAELIPDDKNFNKGTEYGQHLMDKSFEEFGAGRSILLDQNNRVIAGNKSLETYASKGGQKVVIVETTGDTLVAVKRTDVNLDSKRGREMALADNATAKANLDFDLDVINDVCEGYDITPEDWGIDMQSEEDNESDAEKQEHAKLTDKFIVPPFTILDTRQKYWQDRKSMWRNMIGDVGESRENTLDSAIMSQMNNGVSIFDPVLSEIICSWFMPTDGGCIFDPFAGDTQKAFVFRKKGYSFTGIELRQEQIDVNNRVIAETNLDNVRYICDDGQNVANHFEKESQDLLFSCPPYFDLEVYSDNPKDASKQGSYNDFLLILKNAFTNALTCLKQNRFAVVVVGDIRDKKGFYYDFPADVKQIFKQAGALLYNEAVLVESIGTLPQRVGNYMKNRKLGKCHQNILVFYKGDIKEIKNNFKPIDFSSLDEIL